MEEVVTYRLGEEGGYVYSPREDLLDRYDGTIYDERCDALPHCKGEGEVFIPCEGKHQYQCGNNPECYDTYVECPGCPDCET